MKTGIYMIRNKVNNKAYIGQAVDIDRRWSEHIIELNNNQKYCNPHLQNAWNKYGPDNFEFTIICLCEEDELDDFEIDMIAHYHTFYKDGGYNLTFGGDGIRGYRWTDKQRARMSEAAKESMNRPEVKKKHSVAMKEYFKDPENKKKHSGAMKEYYKDPENRKKMIESVREKCAKAVYCVTNDTVYASVSEAGEKSGIDPGWISCCCKGKNITKKYPDGHHKKKGLKKDSPVYEFWYLDEYEEKFGKVAD